MIRAAPALGLILAVSAAPPVLGDQADDDPPATAEAVPSSPAVPVLHQGIALDVEVLGGLRYQGAFAGLADQQLRLSTREGVLELPLPAVLTVVVDGVAYERVAFEEGVRRWGQELIDEAVRTPPPALVGGLSAIWAGAGPAALGNWKSAAGYSLLEASFIGAGAVMIVNEQYGPLLPLAALDALLHVWAAGDSVRESRRRRSRVRLALVPSFASSSGDAPGLGVGLTLHVGGPGKPVSQAVLPRSASCAEQGLTGDCSLPY